MMLYACLVFLLACQVSDVHGLALNKSLKDLRHEQPQNQELQTRTKKLEKFDKENKRTALLKKQEPDYVTQEELDAAIDAVNSNLDTMESTLTSMIDMLSMQILDLQQNRVQRCETGNKILMCSFDCCRVDGSECIPRVLNEYNDYYIAFEEPFPEKPYVSFTAIHSYELAMISWQPMLRGYLYKVDESRITTDGFYVEMLYEDYEENYENSYSLSWMACLN